MVGLVVLDPSVMSRINTAVSHLQILTSQPKALILSTEMPLATLQLPGKHKKKKIKNEAATPARMLPLTGPVPFPPLSLKLLPSKGWVIVLVSLSSLCARLEEFNTALKVLYMQSPKSVHTS